MSHRTQITLTDGQYARLLAESERSGLSLAELTRRALERAYPSAVERATLEALLTRAAGLWSDREESGANYVDRVRAPGMPDRLADLGLT